MFGRTPLMCSCLSTMFPMVSPMFSEFSTIVPGCPTCFHPCFHTVPAFFPAIFPPFSHFYHVWNNSQGISLMSPPCFTTSFTTFHHGFHIFSNVCHVFTISSPCFPPLPWIFSALAMTISLASRITCSVTPVLLPWRWMAAAERPRPKPTWKHWVRQDTHIFIYIYMGIINGIINGRIDGDIYIYIYMYMYIYIYVCICVSICMYMCMCFGLIYLSWYVCFRRSCITATKRRSSHRAEPPGCGHPADMPQRPRHPCRVPTVAGSHSKNPRHPWYIGLIYGRFTGLV